MAITYTGQGDNLRAQELFASLIWSNLVDLVDVRSACLRLGDLGGSGSDTLVTPQISFDDPMTAANVDETTGAGVTALGDTALSLSIAQQIISYEISDKMMITSGPGHLDLARLAQATADAYVLRFTDQVATAMATFSNSVGTTAVNLSLDDLYDAIFQLEESNVPGPYAAILSQKQHTNLQSSLRSEGGAVQFMPATAEQLQIRGPGYKGSFLGTDLWATTVTDDGTDDSGAMFGIGGIVYVEASARAAMPGSIAATVPAGSPIYAEFSRTADPGLSKVTAHAFNAVAVGEDLRGVVIATAT